MISAKAAAGSGAQVVSYRTYVQGFPWTLQSIVPLVDHTGELESWWLPEARRREIFWSREDFWTRWRSGQKLVVVLRGRDAGDFTGAVPAAKLIEERGKYRVVANFAGGGRR